jgi:5'(3')-deoxyribonucleotidase|tara:strand:- start:267 stop:785 length:519 start_codon:yes stop_codon:yes gene_type:complete
MKYITQLEKKSNDTELPSIYCDLDQVLVAFMKGADAAVGGSFVQTDKDERWNKINQTRGFWANLEWMAGAKRLYNFIIRYDAYVLSAYTRKDPTSRNGKMKWLSKNTKFKKFNIKLVLRSEKQQYAMTNGKPNVLIDDYIKNIKEWEAKGGIGIHHTDVGKTINELKRIGFK